MKFTKVNRHIFFGGFFAGLIVGLGTLLQVSTNPNDYLFPLLSYVCTTTEVLGEQVATNCFTAISFSFLFTILLGAILIYRRVRRKYSFWKGVQIYLMGWFIGVALPFIIAPLLG